MYRSARIFVQTSISILDIVYNPLWYQIKDNYNEYASFRTLILNLILTQCWFIRFRRPLCTIFPLLSETQIHFSFFCCYYNSLRKEVEPKRLYPRAILQKEKNSTHDYVRNKRPLQKGTRLQSGSQRKPLFLSAGLSIC